MERARVSLEKVFYILNTMKNAEGKIKAPSGANLTDFIRKRFGWKSGFAASQALKKLEALGYLERRRSGREIVSLKILKDEWSEPEKKRGRKRRAAAARTEKAAPSEKPPAPEARCGQCKKPKERRFAILMDFENLEKNVDRHRLLDFSWLINPILAAGKILVAEVFIPDHYGHNVPVRTLANIHRFKPVYCVKRPGGSAVKDVDSVDKWMDEEGRFLVEYTDITDLVIVSGDADFQSLIQFARWRQKRVRVVAAANAISGRLVFDAGIEKQVVS